MRQRLMMLGAIAAALVGPAGALAAGPGTFEQFPIPAAATSVAQADDGAIWATIGSRHTVVRVAPNGTFSESGDLGGAPAGIAVGAGKVWVAVTSAQKVVAFNPANLGESQTFATPPSSCGPVAVAADGSGAFVSLPNDGSASTCGVGTASALLTISAAGIVSPALAGRGTALDLLVTGGKLWVPDSTGDVVRRLAANDDLTPEVSFQAPGGSGPNGIGLTPDGNIAVSLFSTSALGEISSAANDPAPLVEKATNLSSPFGVAAVGRSLFIAGSGVGGGKPAIRRITYDGTVSPPLTPPAGTQPLDVTAGPDDTAWFSDLASPNLLRFTSRAPRVTTLGLGPMPPGATTSPMTEVPVSLSVNPGGNATAVGIEYGPTTSYGSVTGLAGSLTIDGTSDERRIILVEGLTPGTTYHYRAVAASLEGIARGEDRTFTASAGSGPKPVAVAKLPKITLTRSTKRGLRVTKIRVTGLAGGEKIAVSCSGKGCPAKKRDRTYGTGAKNAGSLTVKATKITRAKLRKGAKVKVVVSNKGATTVIATAKATTSKKLTVTTRCLAPGAKTTTAC
ncbi:MAG: hypothetical protein J7513_06540 [Solirubrobacteraceae bacterium]|nr:hypothetical protein [Solirubrobacteraceae bacterium]